MGRDTLRDLEASVHEAFAAATARRKEVGLAPLKHVEMRETKKGARAGMLVPMFQLASGRDKGQWRPMKYKMTVWLEADEYAALLRLRERTAPDLSPATVLVHMLKDGPAPGQRPVTRAPLSERLKLRPGHGRRAA